MPQIITGNELISALGRASDLLKLPAVDVTYTASHTADQGDVGKVCYMNSASANAFTVPPEGASPFLVNQVLTVCQMGAGATTLTAGAGVTISSAAGLILNAQYAFAGLVYRGSNLWYAFGNLKVS